MNPQPQVTFLELNESGIKFQFSVWMERKNLAELGMQMITTLLRAFAENGIDFGAPRRLHFGDSRPTPLD